MEQVQELTHFYSAIREENRIGTTHISLYMALFQFYNLNEFCNPVEITRTTLMQVSKISGLATYHKCIKDLNDFGYIQYIPSYNPAITSKVYLLCLQRYKK